MSDKPLPEKNALFDRDPLQLSLAISCKLCPYFGDKCRMTACLNLEFSSAKWPSDYQIVCFGKL